MNEFAQAVATLQGYAGTAASRSHYLTERYDEALNDLLRNPARAGDAGELVDAALANARKKLAHRPALMPRAASDSLARLDETGATGTAPEPAVADELPAWFTKLKPRTRRLIALTALGFPPREVARLEGLTPQQSWVALSRARLRARALLEAA